MNKKISAVVYAALGSGIFGLGTIAYADEGYPVQKTINIVVGYPAGGSVDLNGRLLAEALEQKLGRTVVVENLGGAGGAIGAQKVVNQKADGYSLLVGSVNEIIIAGLINPNVKYDGVTDLRPIGFIGSQPMLLAASKTTGVASADDFLKMVETGKSQDFNFGSSGVGTALHLAGEMINTTTKGRVQHVPYKGVAPLLTDMVGGQLQFGMFVLSSGLPQVSAGKIVPIGVTSTHRAPTAPEIPALSENPGFKGVDINIWFGLFAPKDTPEPVIRKLQATLDEVLKDPAFQEKYKRTGGVVMSEQPDLAAFLPAEREKFKKMVDSAGIGVK
ncbi:ABC transporter substrate-binding protein [Pollutimonas nitritireducens]|uniref:ABC transporter substrate-binding protein n=1 Tax=Pollutimonas nitritireducens TaxID=2045209 RepID=A0A2N4UJM2_9BURK|nr:tripartite tricarboxylate transporter substrate binding protein [Pollutimonas nitritireducens]PLC55209.1 ABC transporter substrate-binding protein [Pollutimonas nitritireducens]